MRATSSALGRGEIFLAGGTDAFSSLAYAGFNALHALSAGPCSPLNHSNGISLGEGARHSGRGGV